MQDWYALFFVICATVAALKIACSKECGTIALGVFSVTSCIFYMQCDAPDVALTEASLGMIASVVVIRYALRYKQVAEDADDNKISAAELSSPRSAHNLSAAMLQQLEMFVYFISLMFALIIIFCLGYQELSESGALLFDCASAPVNIGSASYYLQNTERDIGIRSVVAAVLADYRGFDTLCETLVIYIGLYASFCAAREF